MIGPLFDGMVDLEAALADLQGHIALPPTPDLAGSVATRLRTAPAPVTRIRPMRRRLRNSLLLAAAISLLIVATVLGVRFGLPSLGIEFRPPSTSPAPTATSGSSAPGSATSSATPTPSPRPVSLGLGEPTTLDAVRADAPFVVRVPTALPPPDQVFLGGADLRGQIAFLYPASADLPAATLLGGAGLLVTQNLGSADEGVARKLVDQGLATVTPVTVDGAPGFWIEGKPHGFWYLAPDGSAIEGSRRLVGDTLLWERDGVLYRIEGAITMERALDIAESMDAPEGAP
jgi:hypothetical protein